MRMISLEFEVSVKCSKCGSALNAELMHAWDDNQKIKRLDVEPCTDCAKESFNDGFQAAVDCED